MAGNQAGKSNPASKRMMSAAKKAKRVKNKRKNKRKNETMSGLLSDREYRRHELDLMYAREMAAREKTEERMPDYVHHECDVHNECDICHSRRNHHVPKKEAPYTYDFGKWMANQRGTPGALEQERIMGRTIHYINEHPRATEAQIKAAKAL